MLETLIQKHKLEKYAEAIRAAARPCYVGEVVAGDVAFGGSKVGGFPHVPEGFSWPQFRGEPLQFIAQIDCSELRLADLPAEGLLLFFYDGASWGEWIELKGFIHVEYVPTASGLNVVEPPYLPVKRMWGLLGSYQLPRVYKEARISLREDLSLPPPFEGALTFQNDDEAAYCEVAGEFADDRFIQIGGFPNPVQTDDLEETTAQITGRGRPEDWVLVLEVGSGRNTGMEWGDGGTIHYLAHIDDLRARVFSDMWLQAQCG
jgi:uncharacterized protein YwqG